MLQGSGLTTLFSNLFLKHVFRICTQDKKINSCKNKKLYIYIQIANCIIQSIAQQLPAWTYKKAQLHARDNLEACAVVHETGSIIHSVHSTACAGLPQLEKRRVHHSSPMIQVHHSYTPEKPDQLGISLCTCHCKESKAVLIPTICTLQRNHRMIMMNVEKN